ncbi:hypothetical protein BT69DRAFT_1330817 [Atractiella rhizophila]|nr:hypothetical protein BT69DRAFT_1330817 [Atractiella rhizophila]
MDTSAFRKTPKPSSLNPSDDEDPGNLSDDDNAFAAGLRHVPQSNEGIGVSKSFSIAAVLSTQPFPDCQTDDFWPTIWLPIAYHIAHCLQSCYSNTFLIPQPLPSSSRQDFPSPGNVKKMNDQGVRILAIDNGGICTFSTLYMLQVIMLQIGDLLGVPEGEEVRPCDVFDLICGTSTVLREDGLPSCLDDWE